MKPTIPRGWRRLKTGTPVRTTDKARTLSYIKGNTQKPVYTWEPCLWTYAPVDSDEIIIRRKAKKGRK